MKSLLRINNLLMHLYFQGYCWFRKWPVGVSWRWKMRNSNKHFNLDWIQVLNIVNEWTNFGIGLGFGLAECVVDPIFGRKLFFGESSEILEWNIDIRMFNTNVIRCWSDNIIPFFTKNCDLGSISSIGTVNVNRPVRLLRPKSTWRWSSDLFHRYNLYFKIK